MTENGNVESFININIFTLININELKMATITLSIPDDLKRLMDSKPEVKWSEVFRKILIRKVKQLKKFQEMVDRGEI